MGFPSVGIQESWQAFLEWAAERGLPLKNLADWLEERGIPSLPAFALILLVLALGAAFLLLPALAPAKSTLLVTVKSIDGSPVIGANVFLSSPTGAFPQKRVSTNNAGIARFEDVPTGEVKVTVQAADFTVPDKLLTLKAGTNRLSAEEDPSFLAVPKLVTRVSLTVAVRGPGSAKVALFDSLTKEKLNEQEGAIVPFEVEPDKSYSVVVESPGWRSETRFVNVTGKGDQPLDVSLVKNEEDRVGAVHVQVLDAPAPGGRAIPNATIELIENSTEKVLFTLSAGSDGWATQEQVKLGTVLRVQAKAPGRLVASTSLVVQEAENRASLALPPATPPTSVRAEILVEDIDGNKVSGATVRAWRQGERVADALALDGTATLELPSQGSLTITAYKQGFLPASRTLRPLEEPRAKLVLGPATPETASRVKVRVVNIDGLDQAGASVTLTTASREPLGLPELITGLDGLVEFRDVPIGSTVVARAASSGRVSVSEPTNITKEGTPGENATLITLTLLPGQGTIAFTVIDHFTRANVEDALVSVVDGNETCTTKKGTCTLRVQEGTKRFSITAAGYETLTTSEISVLANVVAKQTVELISSSVARSSKLVFLGFFDLRGRKVNALSPASAYQARYVINNPGFDFQRASAHIRLGPQERAIAGEPAAITGWDAAGATAYAGLGYAPGATAGGAEAGGSFVTIGGTPTPTATPTTQVITGQQLQIFGNATPVAGGEAAPLEGGEEVARPALYSAKDLHQAGQKEYKWVEFEFPNFKGSREFSVQFTTRALEEGRVELSHRTAYATRTETVRDPVDAEAGVRKHDLLAALNEPNSIEISFKGECAGSLCVQAWFEGGLGKSTSLFETTFGEEFQLKFKVFTLGGGRPLEAVLGTSAGSLQLVEGVSGTDVAAATTSEGEQRITLPTRTNREGRAEGAFTIQAVRLSKSAVLQLQVNAGATEEDRYSKTLSVRVVGRQPNLNVQVSPSQLKALVDNAITFNVQDPLGRPITDARVTVGRDGDALGSVVEATGQEGARAAPGRYRAEGVKPEASGFVEYSVEAEGFRTARGRLPVVAEDFISVEPKTVTLSVDGKEFQAQEITVTNNLRTEATVSITLLKSSQPTLTQVDTDVTTLRVKPNSAATFSVLAKVSDLVLDVAQRATTLRENVAGRVQVTARAGPRAEQTEEVAFAVQASYAQKGIDELWELSTQSVNLDVKPPAELVKRERLVVKSTSPVPLLINVELPYYPLSAEPLSIIVPPNGESELQMAANIVPEFFFGQGCVMDERTLTGDAVVYASFQGIRSQKTVAITTQITSSDRCTPLGAKGIWLPTNAHFQFLSPVKVKRNVDGSNVVQLPNGDRALFNAPSTATPLEATVPSQAVMEFSPQYLQFLPDGAILRFPAQISLALPAGTALAGPVGAPRSVVFKNIEVQLPPGTQVTAGYALGGSQGTLSQRISSPTQYTPAGHAGNSAPGAVNYNWLQTPSQYGQPGTYGLHGSLSSQVAIIPPNAPILVRAHSPEVPDGKTIRLPVRAILKPPAGSLVIEAEGTGQKVIQLPTRERFAVPADAQTQGLGAAASPRAQQEGSRTLSLQVGVQVAVPIDAELVLPPGWVGKFREGVEDYEVTFPFAVDLELPRGRYTTARLSDGRYLVVLNREQFIELDSTPRLARDTLSVQAGQRIRFGPFKPEAEGGETIAFPATLTLTLPGGTSVLESTDARVLQLPARGEIAEGENTLLVPFTSELRPRNRPTSVELKPDQEFTVPIPWVPERNEDKYVLRTPLTGRINVDPPTGLTAGTLAAGLAQTSFTGGARIREEGGLIVVSELGAASAKAFTVEGGRLEGRVIHLTSASKVTVFVNPPREFLRQCSVEPFEFTIPFNAVFELPGDAILSENNRVVELQSPRTISIFRQGASQFTYRLPKLHKLTFTSGTVTPAGAPRRFGEATVTTEERPTGGVRFSASSGTRVRVDACVDQTPAEEQGLIVRLGDAEGASLRMPNPTSYEGIELPADKQETGRVQATVPFLTSFACSTVDALTRPGQTLLNVPFRTDGVRFSRTSAGEGQTVAVVLDYTLAADTTTSTSKATIDVPPSGLLHFLPCAGRYSTRTSNVVRFESDASSSRLRQADLNASIELNNERLEAEVPLRFYYEGAEPRVYLNYRFGEVRAVSDISAATNGILRSMYLQVAETKHAVDPGKNEPDTPLGTEIAGVYGRVIDQFKVVAQVPRGLRDDLFRCVKTEANVSVTVPVTLYLDRARTRPYGNSELRLNVTIRKTGNCAGRSFALTADLIRGFAVSSEKLSFKNRGHHRYLALTNNHIFPVVAKHRTAPSRVSCSKLERSGTSLTVNREQNLVSGVRIPAGESALVRCESAAVGSDDLDLEARPVRAEISEFVEGARKAVPVTVYDAGELALLYSATPLGEVAVPGTAGSVALCRKDYCSFDQVNAAFKEFATAMSNYVMNEIGSNDTKVVEFCNLLQQVGAERGRLDSASLTKSFTFNMIETVSSKRALEAAACESYADCFEQSLRNQYDRQIEGQDVRLQERSRTKFADLPPGQELRGCGTYKVTFRTPAAICPGVDRKTFLSRAYLAVTIDKIASCEPHPANAALLTSEEPRVHIGREFASSFPGLFAEAPRWTIGEYRPGKNAIDEQNARMLYNVLYKTQEGFNATPAITYADGSFCTPVAFKHMTPIATAAGAAIAAASASITARALTVIGIPDAIASAPAALRAVAALTTFVATCGAGIAVRAVPGGRPLDACGVWEDCTVGAIGAFVDALTAVPPGGGWAGFAAQLGIQFAASTAVMGAFELLTSESTTDIAGVPAAVVGGRVIREEIGSTRFIAQALERRAKIPPTLSREMARAFAKGDAVRFQDMAQRTLAIRRGVPISSLPGADVTRLVRQAEDVAFDAARATTRGRFNLRARGVRGARPLGTMVRFVTSAVVIALFNPDYKPVEAEVDKRFFSHNIVFHNEPTLKPPLVPIAWGRSGKTGSGHYAESIYRFCLLEEGGTCSYQFEGLGTLCPLEEKNACFYLTPDRRGLDNGYVLLAAFNEPTLRNEQFLQSVFLPETRPLSKRDFPKLEKTFAAGVTAEQLLAAQQQRAPAEQLIQQAQQQMEAARQRAEQSRRELETTIEQARQQR